MISSRMCWKSFNFFLKVLSSTNDLVGSSEKYLQLMFQQNFLLITPVKAAAHLIKQIDKTLTRK